MLCAKGSHLRVVLQGPLDTAELLYERSGWVMSSGIIVEITESQAVNRNNPQNKETRTKKGNPWLESDLLETKGANIQGLTLQIKAPGLSK